jgi:hypothetical protein
MTGLHTVGLLMIGKAPEFKAASFGGAAEQLPLMSLHA